MVQEIALELAGRAVVAQVNTQENPQLAARFNITGIPALLFLRREKVIDMIGGARDKHSVIAWFNEHA